MFAVKDAIAQDGTLQARSLWDDEFQFLVLSTSAPFLIIEIALARDLALESWIKP